MSAKLSRQPAPRVILSSVAALGLLYGLTEAAIIFRWPSRWHSTGNAPAPYLIGLPCISRGTFTPMRCKSVGAMSIS